LQFGGGRPGHPLPGRNRRDGFLSQTTHQVQRRQQFTADAIQRTVEKMGHRTAWVCTGPETLHCLASRPCQLLILSAQLRDAEILGLLPALRRRYPDIPVVALTAHNSLSLEQQVRQIGGICYLIKPLDIVELGSTAAHVSPKNGIVVAHPKADAPSLSVLASAGKQIRLWPYRRGRRAVERPDRPPDQRVQLVSLARPLNGAMPLNSPLGPWRGFTSGV